MNRRLITEQLPRLLGYRLAYQGLIDPPTPINLTLSITNRCNSRCKTCDIWRIYPDEQERLKDELDLARIEKIFRSIGSVYFFNLSGGEPFLRSDLVDIVRLACEILHPKVVHIPTNALMPERIEQKVAEMLAGMETWGNGQVKLTIKPSFDGVGALHDEIRGVPGNWEKLSDTLERLARLKNGSNRLGIGVGTVISNWNVNRLPEIIRQGKAFDVDTYISEIAEERCEMRNLGQPITPTAEDYSKAIVAFKEDTFERLSKAHGLELLTLGIRHVYYDLTTKWLEQRRQIIPCFAAITNVHISAYGEIWPCAVLAESRSLGSLAEVGDDFWAIWHSDRANEVRAGIRAGQCDCPLANQAYANVLMSPSTLLRVGKRIAQAKLSSLRRRMSGARRSGETRAKDGVA